MAPTPGGVANAIIVSSLLSMLILFSAKKRVQTYSKLEELTITLRLKYLD
jgi:formiminotetrahydrofolate cyclodeaminase